MHWSMPRGRRRWLWSGDNFAFPLEIIPMALIPLIPVAADDELRLRMRRCRDVDLAASVLWCLQVFLWGSFEQKLSGHEEMERNMR